MLSLVESSRGIFGKVRRILLQFWEFALPGLVRSPDNFWCNVALNLVILLLSAYGEELAVFDLTTTLTCHFSSRINIH